MKINNKKENQNKINLIEKLLKFLILLVSIILILYTSIQFTLNYLTETELSEKIVSTKKEIEDLEKNKNSLSKLSLDDIMKIKEVFEEKKYNKDILIFETGKVEFLEKAIKKETGKAYATIKIPFRAEKEIDLRKYLVFQSLNKNIYKLTDVRKEKEMIIEIIYEL